MLAFTRTDLERLFPSTTWQRAESLRDQSAVVEINVERDGRSITGRVRGERRTPYLTRVNIVNGRGGRIRLSSTCTCLVYSECEHAAATLLAALDETAAPDADEVSAAIDPELEAWIAAINQSARAQTNGHASDGADCVLYVLEPAQRLWRDAAAIQPLAVSTFRARRLRGGLYGREHPLAMSNLVAEDPASFVAVDDQVIGRLLGGAERTDQAAGLGRRRRHAAPDAGDRPLPLAQRPGLQPCRSRGRGPAGSAGASTARASSTSSASWRTRAPTWSSSAWASPGTSISRSWPAAGSRPECRIGSRGCCCGRRPCPPPSPAWSARSCSPAPRPSSCPSPCASASGRRCARRRCSTCTARRVTTSRGLGWKREEQEVDLPLARVLFDYAGADIGWQDGRAEINHVKDNRLLVLPRDTLFEVQMIERLNGLGLQPLGPTGLGRFAPENCRQDFTFEEDEDDDVSMRWVEFNHQDLPKLARDGWRITFGEDYPYQVVAADDAWKVDVNDSGIDWFDLDLGIDVDGERVALLPILLDLFERAPEDLSPTALDEIGEDHVFGTLPDGRLLPIPAARLKAMLEALYELFASRRIGDDGKLRLSRAEMTRLTAIETALPNGALHWTGGQMLRDMARLPRQHQRDPSRRRRPRGSRRRCATTRRTASPGCSS